ncbi:hypothetical protein UWK_02261 [Desulfocapsa sulfexigens DSM 10523]|uniref:Nucleotidyltransferase family protein n=1 Tax=Desulfocapsa sulfexigens (strain DSM 10523 / SB164P1) TaxID=1167006 RepID=M1PQX9_DESSD|nr:nucleotidyltransferase family protein [Desulfocapsa sulfexigens]AGF78801.1 hypothetical protein UWK_02261 [Desulfocapsa sulfexigens DSM 10523]
MTSKLGELRKVFDSLHGNEVEFIFLRGFSDVPKKVSLSNDLDILCKPKHKKTIEVLFSQLGYKCSEDSRDKNIYLYNAEPHQHFFCRKRDLHFDIVYSLAYQSPNHNEWVSVHQEIQKSIWKNKKRVQDIWFFQPDNTDLAIHLICHSIFDKREFRRKHIKELETITPYIDFDKYRHLLTLIFFKFTPYLIKLIENKDYESVFASYMMFKEY